eukprot:scaffold22490_cov22-Tisochrysis_lutea.AAC.2
MAASLESCILCLEPTHGEHPYNPIGDDLQSMAISFGSKHTLLGAHPWQAGNTHAMSHGRDG